MVRAVRPFRSLSMARGCARIDSRLDTVKISLAGRVEVHHARFLAVIGVRKTFPHGLDPKRTCQGGVSAIAAAAHSGNLDLSQGWHLAFVPARLIFGKVTSRFSYRRLRRPAFDRHLSR